MSSASAKSGSIATPIPCWCWSIRLARPATREKSPVFIERLRRSPMSDMLSELQAIIADRQQNPKPGSYTNSLFNDGISRIAQKVGEEATEVVVAALSQTRDLQIAELSDL